jgi:hypothetical protein
LVARHRRRLLLLLYDEGACILSSSGFAAHCTAKPTMVGVGGVLSVFSGSGDVLELRPSLTPKRLARCDRGAGSRRAIHVVWWRGKFGPTANTRNTARILHDYDHGKFRKPKSSRNISINCKVRKLS